MADHDESSDGDVWDEFRWERFLQQQDRETEKFFDLLEEHHAHPDMEEIIAREMGWDADGKAASHVPELFEEEPEQEEEFSSGPGDDGFEVFSRTPLYQSTVRLHLYVSKVLSTSSSLHNSPAGNELFAHITHCGSKVTAGLWSDHEELGMSIAYLKRALKSANDALAITAQLRAAKELTPYQGRRLRSLIFEVRDSIVVAMGDLRQEWTRRYGHGL